MKRYNMRTEEAAIDWIPGVGYSNAASISPDSNSNGYSRISRQNTGSNSLKKYNFFLQKRHPVKKIIELKANYEEGCFHKLNTSAGGRWNREKKLWELRFLEVVTLGLEKRIVLFTGKKA
jgi:hypothetical protein